MAKKYALLKIDTCENNRSHIKLQIYCSCREIIIFSLGDNLGVAFVKSINVRNQQRSMPSTAWLMPSDMFWGKDEILVERPGRNYTVNDFKQFFF